MKYSFSKNGCETIIKNLKIFLFLVYFKKIKYSIVFSK